MLNIEYCRELLENEKYDKIYNILEEEYINSFYKLIGKEKDESLTLLKLLLEVNAKYPKYEGTFKILREAFFNEKMTDAERISFLLYAYHEIVKLIKKI